MKRLLQIIIIITLSSCSDYDYSCKKDTIIILNKETAPCTRGGSNECSWRFYLYDGSESYWCITDKDTFYSYDKGDTLSTLVITKTIKK